MTNQMCEAIKQNFGTDPEKAIKVNMTEVNCPHVEGSTISTRLIKLKQWRNGEKIVGWLGYCYTCEKVYYIEN